MKKSFLMIIDRGASTANFQIYRIVNNVPEPVIEGEFSAMLMPLREFALRQIARAGFIDIPYNMLQEVNWNLIKDVTLTIVDGYGRNNITIDRALHAEWGDGSVLASWLLNCDTEDINYIIEQSEKLDMYYEDILDYLKGSGITKPSAEDYIKEMQRVLVRRANQALNPLDELNEDGHFTDTLEAGKHYLIGSDVKTAFIVPKDFQIVQDFGLDHAQAAIDILRQWGSR